MKSIVYLVGSLLLVVWAILACQDHRSGPVPADHCPVTQTVVMTDYNPKGLPFELSIVLDEHNTGSPLPTGLPPGNRIKLVAYSWNTIYRYDGQGRLVYESSTAPDFYPEDKAIIVKYSYSPASLTVTRFFQGLAGDSVVETYTLNKQGQITAGRVNGGQRTYTYDAAGYLTELVHVGFQGDTIRKNYTIEAGNVTKVVNRGPTYQQTVSYNYDLSRLNPPDTRVVLPGETYTSSLAEVRQSRNLLIKRVDDNLITQPTASGQSTTIRMVSTSHYTYTFDSQNRVLSRLNVQTTSTARAGEPPGPTSFLDASALQYTYGCP